MRSDLTHLAREARATIAVPPFPAFAIRSAVQHRPRPSRRRTIAAAALAALSVAGLAAAAVLHQTQLTFTHSGGLVIKANVQNSKPIHDAQEIRAAARNLDFRAVLPAGLPEGTQPTQLYTAGRSLMAVTYNLPGAQRVSHHLLWIFLADPDIVAGSLSHPPKYGWRTGKAMIASHWRIGAEEVILVSNGLTQSERAAVKSAMEREAR